MKRNEKILVYGVTGFLLAILVIAVIFGNEDLTRAVEARGKPEGPRTLQEVMIADLGEEAARDLAGEPGLQEKTAVTGEEAQVPDPVEGAEQAQVVPETTAPGELIGPQPLVIQPSAEVVTALGKSRREGDYRVVEIQPEDTFRQLVLRWCGSLEYQARVERLNEGLVATAMPVASEMWLPWVDDDVLWEAYQARQAQEAVVARSEPRLYTVQRGDSLWKLAENAVGLGGAPAYIERIKAANPNITDFDRLQVGQQIKLPPIR